jgi:tetratricopeptide (TPR) repeat protein
MHNPPALSALGALGDLELYHGHYDRVMEISRAILSQDPRSATKQGYKAISRKAELLMACALYKKGRRKEALPILEKLYPELSKGDYFASDQDLYYFMKMLSDCRSDASVEDDKAEK